MIIFTQITVISRGIWWRGNATFWIALLQLLQLYFLAHWLDPEDFGVYAILRTIIGFGGYFTDAGMYNAILYGKKIPPRLFTTLYLISLVVGVVMWLLLSVSAPYIALFYTMPMLDEMLFYIGLALLFSSIGGHYKAALQRDTQFKKLAWVDTLSQLVGTSVTLMYAYYSPDIRALVFGYLSKVFVASLGYVGVGYAVHPLRRKLTKTGLQYYLHYAKFQLPERILTYWNANVDVLIIGKILGQDILGVYELFKQFLRRAVHVVNPLLDHVLTPLMTATHRRGEQIAPLYLRMVEWSALVLFPVYIGLFLVSSGFVQWFFGSPWVTYSTLFRWFCVYYILHSVVQHIGALWVGINRPDLGFYWNLGLVFVLPAVVYLSAFEGPENIAMNLSFLMFIQGIALYYLMIRPYLQLRFISYLSVLIWPLLYAVTAYLISFGMKWLIVGQEQEWWWVLIPGTAMYLLFLYVFERGKLKAGRSKE